MCVPILRSIGTKLTNLENMKNLYVIKRHVTQKGNMLQPTRSLYDLRLKSYGSNGGFNVFWWHNKALGVFQNFHITH